MELDTSYNVIERIQNRTKLSLEKLMQGYINMSVMDRYNIIADGLSNQGERREVIEQFKKELPLAKLNFELLQFVQELMFDGLTQEEREELQRKNIEALTNPNRM